MELATDEKGSRLISHSPTCDYAEPEPKKQRLGGDSDGDGNGSSGGVICGLSRVFIGNEQDDVYFEEYKYMLDPEDYENSTLEQKRRTLLSSDTYLQLLLSRLYPDFSPLDRT
ncbi:unnamed protein product [Cuscuta campestris]|uniref:Uncharacterized protein n=1 Tax=Cuscuta campestris TaxID=132261 RepID=A0A484NFI8_9ASTE|nr:unnamed protein product [Cuscuta campestris]